MTDPVLLPDRYRMKALSSAPASPSAGYVRFYLDNNTGYPAIKDPSAVITSLAPNAVPLFYGNPNDNGGWNIDLSAGEALNCLHLELVWELRGNVNANSDILRLWYNASATATDFRNSYGALADGATNGASGGGNAPDCAFITAYASGLLEEWSRGTARIDWFRSTLYRKVAFIANSYNTTTSVLGDVQFVHRWQVTPAAITSLQLRVDGYPTDTLESRSKLLVIGYRS